MDKTTEILIEAKRILEEDLEWCKLRMYRRDENHNIIAACAVGAIGIAAGIEGTNYTADQADAVAKNFNGACDRLQEIVSTINPIQIVSHFNDHSTTTKEDVLMAFKRAINETGE